jgi:hypothetical protein
MNRVTGCLGGIARLVAALLAVVFVLTLPVSLALHDLGRLLFTPRELGEFLVDHIVDTGLVRSLVTDRLLSEDSLGGGAEEGFDLVQAMQYLEPAEVEGLLDVIIPAGWAREQVVRSLESLYDWLDNDQSSPSLVLDVAPLRQNLLAGGVARLVETIVDSWPACTVEQTETMNQAAAGTGEVPVLYCEPPEPFRTSLSEAALVALSDQVARMPAEIALGGAAQQPSGPASAEVMALKEQIRLVRALSRWGWLIPLSLLGLIMALAVRSFQGLGRWWGIPLLLGGLLSFTGVFVIGILFRRFLLPTLVMEGMPETLTSLIHELLTAMVNDAQGRLLGHAALVSLVGVILLILGWASGRRRARARRDPVETGFPAAGGPPAATGRAQSTESPPQPDEDTRPGMFG